MSIADKLTTIAENVSKVYQAGYDKGVAEGGDEAVFQQGYEAGKTAEWENFWDAYQTNGYRTNYERAFWGNFWTEKNFKPKYDIAPSGSAVYLFGNGSLESVDLTDILEKAEVVLDVSNATNIGYAFQGHGVKRIPVIDASKSLVSLNEAFRLAYKLETIDGLILQANGSNTWSLAFNGATALREITKIEGVIGNNIDFTSCQLSKQTIYRIFNALSADTTGNTCNFSKYRINMEFATSEGLQDGSTSDEWLALVATKPNWNIVL